jgi:hypothetical protein
MMQVNFESMASVVIDGFVFSVIGHALLRRASALLLFPERTLLVRSAAIDSGAKAIAVMHRVVHELEFIDFVRPVPVAVIDKAAIDDLNTAVNIEPTNQGRSDLGLSAAPRRHVLHWQQQLSKADVRRIITQKISLAFNETEMVLDFARAGYTLGTEHTNFLWDRQLGEQSLRGFLRQAVGDNIGSVLKSVKFQQLDAVTLPLGQTEQEIILHATDNKLRAAKRWELLRSLTLVFAIEGPLCKQQTIAAAIDANTKAVADCKDSALGSPKAKKLKSANADSVQRDKFHTVVVSGSLLQEPKPNFG